MKMTNQLAQRISEIAKLHGNDSISDQFIQRLSEDQLLTRDENPRTHYCVYFAAYDPTAKEVFIGHHKKSGLWLFNGGHIDRGETPEEALLREIGEEWGLKINLDLIGEPKLLTITEINNPTKQTCTRHYDIWYFVPVEKERFMPAEALLSKEFYKTDWLSPAKAQTIITDPGTLKAISTFEDIFNQDETI